MRCPQCGGRMIRCKDEEGRWYLCCVDCGAQMPIDWGRGVIEKKGVMAYKK